MSAAEIVVSPAVDLVRRGRLLDAVAELYGIRFVAESAHRPASNAIVLFAATRAEALAWAQKGVRCLAFLAGPARALPADASEVAFSETSRVSPLFRGTRLADHGITHVTVTERQSEDETIAEKGGHPIWVSCRQERCAADLVTAPAPVLGESEYLFEHFREHDWASLLPLLHFVADVSGWQAPPLRACFMFDDPNLHWSSYGYVKFREIVDAARAEQYHTSFATVPMDAWLVHAPTARLFRENADLLSLLIHGNDHTRLELQTPRQATPIALAAQALNRITQLEHHTGLSVARVMAAPHGACSEGSAKALLKTGFDAACISTGSLMSRNPDLAWPGCVGMRPAEFLGGLPVIPRVNIDLSSDVPVRLAGFLGQPIVPVGHHDDLRDGLAVLSRSARLIKSIGEVRWMDMTALSELNYSSRLQGSTLDVRMYARRIRITVPTGVTHVSVHRPWQPSPEGEHLVLSSAQGDVTHRQYRGQPLEVVEGESTVRAVDAEAIDAQRVRFPQPSIHAIVRRQLCEARDRLRPAFDRVAGLYRER